MGWKVEEVSRQMALAGLFDVTLTAADVERGKPDPACYLAAAARLRVAPTECVVFEDAVSGVRAAVAAGMACVGVQTGHLADLLERGVSKVYAAARRPESVTVTDPRVVPLQLDVTDADSIRRAAETAADATVLVNNAGIAVNQSLVSGDLDEIHREFDTNFWGPVLLTRAFAPGIAANGGGAIVNLSSVAGLRHVGPGRDNVAYSAAKAGVIQFSRSTAITFAKKNIRCNTVVPGLMHTPLLEARLAPTVAGGDVAALIAARDAQVPMGHMGDGWDVAHAVLFLVSDEARYVTGTEIIVDGGLVAQA